MMLVDLRKGNESNCFLPYFMLVYLGATYNQFSQAVADRIGMQLAKSGRLKQVIAKLHTVTTVNSK